MNRPLTPFEQWMVKSNLKTIEAGMPADKLIAQLRANGYPHIADAVALGKPYGYVCDLCGEQIYDNQAVEHSETGLVHSECP